MRIYTYILSIVCVCFLSISCEDTIDTMGPDGEGGFSEGMVIFQLRASDASVIQTRAEDVIGL